MLRGPIQLTSAGPCSGARRTVVTFFHGEDGSFAEAHDLDPSDLVPYNSEKYAELTGQVCLTLDRIARHSTSPATSQRLRRREG